MPDSEPTNINKRTTLPAGFLKHPVHVIALGFGAGCSPWLPGTMGTLIGVLIYLALQDLDRLVYLVAVVVMFLPGIWLCGQTASDLEVHDHSAIVWDEIVGYLITMALAPPGWIWILLGFVLFRLFDIWKPWPIRVIDHHLGGGLGIMLDDVLAGIYSLACIYIIGASAIIS